MLFSKAARLSLKILHQQRGDKCCLFFFSFLFFSLALDLLLANSWLFLTYESVSATIEVGDLPVLKEKEDTKMKKLICLVVLVLVAALCLGSCGWIIKWFPSESDGELTLAAKIDYAPDVILTTDMSVEDLRQHITVVAYCGSLSDASLGKIEVTDYNLLCDIAEGYCDIEIEYQGATFQLKDYFFDKSYIEYDGDFVFYNRIMPLYGPSLIRYIGNDAEVTLPERSPYAVYTSAFFGNQTMTVLHLGNSVKEIESYAFFGCTALKEIYFDNSLNCVHSNAFLGCDSLEKVEAPSLEIWCSIDFSWDGTRFFTLPKKGYLPSDIQFKEYEIKDPVYVIDPQLPKTEDLDYGSDNNSQSDNGSQSDNSSQSLVTVPVYSGAFYYYYNGLVYTLHSVDNPLQIAQSLWINGEHITELVIPESVTYIYGDAFRGADITSVEIHSGVTHIGYRAFTFCKELKKVNIYSQDVIYSGTLGETFDASAMTDYMGGKYLGNEQNPYLVFVSVGNGEEFVEIHEDAVVISSKAFSGKFAFPSLVIHDGIKKISRSAFSGLSADTELYIGSGVEEIGERAMYSSASGSVFNNVVYANNSGWYYIDEDGNEVSFDPCSINKADDEALKYTWYLRSVSED